MGDTETRLTKAMRDAGKSAYGERLVTIKYHGSQFGQAGVSDLLMCLDGLFVAAEVKAPESYGGSIPKAESAGPTKLQLSFIEKIEAAGGVGDVVASVPHFLDLLARAERKVRDSCGGCVEASRNPTLMSCVIHDG